VSGFQKVALPIGILAVLSGIAGLMQTHFFRSERNAAFLRPLTGSHFVEAGGVKFHIPAGYVSSISPNGRDVELTSEPGTFSIQMYVEEKVREGKMNFWLQNELVSRLGGKKMRELMSLPFGQKSLRYVADHPYSLAGQEGVCSEYRVHHGGEITYGTRLGIVCTFGDDKYADFQGTLLGAVDFYKIVESAEPLQRKN
jgi:hypothetical protein